MAKPVPFVPGQPAFRNTWKNHSGCIRTNLYDTREKAQYSAFASRYLFQEIATPVWPGDCLVNPREVLNHG
jgi:hypothetical protein